MCGRDRAIMFRTKGSFRKFTAIPRLTFLAIDLCAPRNVKSITVKFHRDYANPLSDYYYRISVVEIVKFTNIYSILLFTNIYNMIY